MDPCHNPRPLARRSFIITPYGGADDGSLRPSMPDRCNQAAAEGTGCELRAHHWRERKTGPQFPLLVVRCETHGVAFTLYPPGHVPYGRVAVAAVDDQGKALYRADDTTVVLQLAWEQTLFGAAKDAEKRIAWPRSYDAASLQCSWRTQGRYITQASEVLGLTGSEHPSFVGGLGVSALGQREAATTYRSAGGYEARGRAVCMIVDELELTPCDLLDVILRAGFAAGRWGRPRRWDERFGLRDVVRARSP
jgi:hypothetical protein